MKGVIQPDDGLRLRPDNISAETIDLDYLHWEPNWAEAPDEVFRERVENAISARAWVVAGNYHVVRDIVWAKAQTA